MTFAGERKPTFRAGRRPARLSSLPETSQVHLILEPLSVRLQSCIHSCITAMLKIQKAISLRIFHPDEHKGPFSVSKK